VKSAFVHDHRFLEKDQLIFSQGGLPKKIWSRYLKHFKEIIVIGRRSRSVFSQNLTLSSTKGVSFNLIDEYDTYPDALRHYKRIKKRLRRIIQHADITIIRLPSVLGFFAIICSRELGKPYAIEVAGCPWDSMWNYGNLAGKAAAPLLYLMQKRFVKKADFVIYVTKYFLQNRYPTNGFSRSASNVRIEALEKQVLEKHINRIQQKRKPVQIGMIGSLDVRYKGFDIALKALFSIKDTIPDFELNLVGQGNGNRVMTVARKYGIENKVKIIGRLKSGQDIFDLLDSLTLYLHPSRTEGLPRSLIEAMSRGCPCLASDRAGISELLDQIYLHKPGDHKTLSEQIATCLNSDDMLFTMARDNFSRAADYTVEKLDKKRDEFWGFVKKDLTCWSN
jgi:glycosyltransferase involved in cell wall biosynthesis